MAPSSIDDGLIEASIEKKSMSARFNACVTEITPTHVVIVDLLARRLRGD